MKTPVEITAVWLRRRGTVVEVLVERPNGWRLAITEDIESNFSNCAHGNGAENWPPDPLEVKP